MFLTPLQTLATIFAIALGTMITRFTPFLIFPENKEIPPFVLYLGKLLPPATMGLLVVFCFKGVSFVGFPFGLPELIASACVIILHVLKGNVLLSIAAGTGIYMFLVQAVF